ncbi:MAG: cell division protein ZapE, partial [Hyphomicrobium sp.]
MTSTTIVKRYLERLALGELDPDARQRAMAERLDALQHALDQFADATPSLLTRFFTRRDPSADVPRGLYIHGKVGRGKTMLMDLFFEECAVAPKRRAHFHEFMADVHERIAVARADVPGDPIPHVAREIASEARLLCFDELHVTDIADAMILGRLFTGLFAAGTVVVATSNAAPGDLYKNGLNRQLFLPFIDLIERHMDVVTLDAEKDFRLEKLSGAPLYYCPADDRAREALDGHWARLTGGHPGKPVRIEFKGRHLDVPLASMGVARFPFDSLCNQPLGSLDFL